MSKLYVSLQRCLNCCTVDFYVTSLFAVLDPNTCGNSEERGEVKEDREILAEDDSISVALIHSPKYVFCMNICLSFLADRATTTSEYIDADVTLH